MARPRRKFGQPVRVKLTPVLPNEDYGYVDDESAPIESGPIRRVSWDEFIKAMDWKQGEHVSIIGATGSGKSWLALALMHTGRDYCVALGPKPRDPTLDEMIAKRGWIRIPSWDEKPQIDLEFGKRPPPQRVIVWPKYRRIEDADSHPKIFGETLGSIFADGRWAVFIDECAYFTSELRLERLMKRCWQQGRSLKLSMVSAVQRPFYVPREFLSEAAHIFIFGMSDAEDIKRLQDVGGPTDKARIRKGIRMLNWKNKEFLYVDARSGNLLISVAPAEF